MLVLELEENFHSQFQITCREDFFPPRVLNTPFVHEECSTSWMAWVLIIVVFFEWRKGPTIDCNRNYNTLSLQLSVGHRVFFW